MLSKQSRDRQCAANGGCKAIMSACCRKTSRPTTKSTLIDGLSCCTGSGAKMGLRSACRFNGRFLQRVLVFSHREVPCGNGLVEIVPYRSLVVWTIRISYPIGISYLIDSRCLSSMSLLKLAPVCLHAMFVLGGTSRGALVCHRLVPIVISPMSPYYVWY